MKKAAHAALRDMFITYRKCMELDNDFESARTFKVPDDGRRLTTWFQYLLARLKDEGYLELTCRRSICNGFKKEIRCWKLTPKAIEWGYEFYAEETELDPTLYSNGREQKGAAG